MKLTKRTLQSGLFAISSLLILSTVSACSSSSAVNLPPRADYCDTYSPVYLGPDARLRADTRGVIELNNALFAELCLGNLS